MSSKCCSLINYAIISITIVHFVEAVIAVGALVVEAEVRRVVEVEVVKKVEVTVKLVVMELLKLVMERGWWW